MKPLVMALAALVLAGGLALVVATSSKGAFALGPVYTVAQLRAGLADNPRAWIGRTLLVRGVAIGPIGLSCPPNASCPLAWPALIDAGAGNGPTLPLVAVSVGRVLRIPSVSVGRVLPLSLGPADPLLALLRRLPLVGRLVPGPQVLRWGKPTIYRVQVQDVAGPSPNAALPYRVLLLDPGPYPLPAGGPLPIWRGPAWGTMPAKPATVMPIARPLPPITMPHAMP
jgi:hypothetical protein